VTSAGSAFGRYELIRRLDGGGMGEVFLARARGPERVQKTVVLKRMRTDRASDEHLRARFVDEARVAVSLSHPHIVPVFEFGELDGQYFIVMEWLRGGNLAGIAGSGRPPLSWAATALVGSQMCDALAYVHGRRNRQGAALVHGDVTPRNVLLSTDGHVLLADFGLARFAPRGRAGTARYLAPEQARGEAIDGRADLYALALVLSEAVTGMRVYDADPETAARQAKSGVMPDLNGCDAELAQLLRRALAAQPSGRHREATQMREAFDALLDREPRARANARAELIARTSQAGADAQALVTSLSRADQSVMATRDATAMADRRRRWPLWAALLLGVIATGATLARAFVPRAPAMPAATTVAPRPPAAAPTPTVTVTAQPMAPSPPGAPAPRTGDPAHHARAAAPHVAAPAETGFLDINATPWARVRIDGQSRGETPVLQLAIAAGSHRIELVNEPLGVRRELVVTVGPGEHVQRIIDLNEPASP
jgi:tRNA A-37 threonylcarbamoyl transferase component Bud32